jgi:hypothetical protein
MLNLFPIQFLAPLAFTILRLAIGILCLTLGYRRIKSLSFSARLGGGVSFAIGILYILGAYTQLAAIISGLGAFLSLLPERYRPFPPFFSRTTTLLVIAVSLSLFITGGGAFAFDLPI